MVKVKVRDYALALMKWNWNSVGHVQKRLAALEKQLQAI